jgi:hypothetical protein
MTLEQFAERFKEWSFTISYWTGSDLEPYWEVRCGAPKMRVFGRAPTLNAALTAAVKNRVDHLASRRNELSAVLKEVSAELEDELSKINP